MPKTVLRRKTSRGAGLKQRVINSSSAMKYAGSAVQTLGGLRDNPEMFRYGHYEHIDVPSLEEVTGKARAAMEEGRLRAAVTYALDISEILVRMPSDQKLLGGKHYKGAEEARGVADAIIARLQEQLHSAAR
jgi:hypothetical protein